MDQFPSLPSLSSAPHLLSSKKGTSPASYFAPAIHISIEGSSQDLEYDSQSTFIIVVLR